MKFWAIFRLLGKWFESKSIYTDTHVSKDDVIVERLSVNFISNDKCCKVHRSRARLIALNQSFSSQLFGEPCPR